MKALKQKYNYIYIIISIIFSIFIGISNYIVTYAGGCPSCNCSAGTDCSDQNRCDKGCGGHSYGSWTRTSTTWEQWSNEESNRTEYTDSTHCYQHTWYGGGDYAWGYVEQQVCSICGDVNTRNGAPQYSSWSAGHWGDTVDVHTFGGYIDSNPNNHTYNASDNHYKLCNNGHHRKDEGAHAYQESGRNDSFVDGNRYKICTVCGHWIDNVRKRSIILSGDAGVKKLNGATDEAIVGEWYETSAELKDGFHFHWWLGTYPNDNGGITSNFAYSNVHNIWIRSGENVIEAPYQYTAYTEYTVRYDANGGTGSMSDQTGCWTVEAYKIKSNSFTRAGYHFIGWSTSPNGGVVYVPNQEFRALGDTTLYAVWELNDYNIYYTKGLTNNNSSMGDTYTRYNQHTTLRNCSYVGRSYNIYFRDGSIPNHLYNSIIYETDMSGYLPFSHWSSDKGGTYGNGSSFYYPYQSNMTLTAQWSNKTISGFRDAYLSGWRFDGWYTSASGGTRTTSLTISPSTSAYSTTLYAHYTDLNPVIKSVSSSTNTSSSQTLSITASDSGSGIRRVTVGTSANGTDIADYTYSSQSETRTYNATVSNGGTYYITVYDWNGNKASTSATYYTISFAKGLTDVNGSMTKQIAFAGTTVAIQPNTFTGRTYNIYFNEGSHPNNLYSVNIGQGTISGHLPFNRWRGSNGGYYSDRGSITVNSNITLTAEWSDVTKNGYANASLTGWTFNGWYTSASGGSQITTRTISQSATGYSETLYARWTDLNPTFITTSTNNYDSAQTVTINATDSGSGIKNIVIKSGNTVVKNWDFSDGKETKSVSHSIQTNGRYTITVTDRNNNQTSQTIDYFKTILDGNGSTDFPLTVDVDKSYILTCTNINGTNTNYKFNYPTVKRVGFHSPNKDDGRTNYFNTSRTATTGNTSYTPSGNGSTTHYAVWIANTYTVVYNSNPTSITPKNKYGDDFTTNPTGTTNNVVYTYDKTKNIASNGYSREGYTFVCWNTKANGTGTSYTANQTYGVTTNLTNTNEGTVTLYAIWEPVKYNVVFDTNGTTDFPSSSGSRKDNIRFDEYFNIASAPTRTEYEFAYWQIYSGASAGVTVVYNNTETDPMKTTGNVTKYNPNQSVRNLSKNGGTVTIDAIWKHIHFDAVFSGMSASNKNGRVYYSSLDPQNANGGAFYYNTDELSNVECMFKWKLTAPIWQKITKYEVIKDSGNVVVSANSGDTYLKISDSGKYHLFESKDVLTVGTGNTHNDNYGMFHGRATVTCNWSDSHHTTCTTNKVRTFDTSNRYGIYGDGTTPNLLGIETLQDNLLGIDLTEVADNHLNTIFSPTTSDDYNSSVSYSGITKDSYIKITNLDNGVSTYLEPYTIEENLSNTNVIRDSQNNRISDIIWQSFDLSERNNLVNELFSGKIAIIYYLKDNVGHIYTNTDNPDTTSIFDMELTLTSKSFTDTTIVSGIPSFIQGEAINLKVFTSGYANGLYIKFPTSFADNPDYPLYVYWGNQTEFEEDKYDVVGSDGVFYLSNDKLTGVQGVNGDAETNVNGDWTVNFIFTIPLYANDDETGSVLNEISVIAYKGDTTLDISDYISLSQIQINEGMVTQINGNVKINALKRIAPFYVDTEQNILDRLGHITTIIDTFR